MVRYLILFFIISSFGTSVYGQTHQTDSARKKISSIIQIKRANNNVRLFTKNPTGFKSWLKAQMPDAHVIQHHNPNFFNAYSLSDSEIIKLQNCPWVKFIDKGNRVAAEERALGNFDLTLNAVVAAQTTYPLITGDGIVISVKEKPFDLQDLDLRNRIVVNDQFDEPATIHATIMATIAAGAGNTEPSGKGVAPGALLTTSDFAELMPDNETTLTSLGVSVQNHSYGVGVENYYGLESIAYDKQCRDNPTLMHVFSSGNQGDQANTVGTYANLTGFANLTGQFKISKNTLCVGSADKTGNVVLRSSRGPAHDGRVKPELIAYGDAGSSDAAAVVTGIVALIQEGYQNQHGILPTSSLVKALLINSAQDVGRAEVDFETGYGNVNAAAALKTLEANNFISGIVTHQQENTHSINVPSGTYQLKVTLVWNDVEASPEATQALVNDLDLMVTHPNTGTSWLPWVLNHEPSLASLTQPAQRQADHVNVVEQVTITNPPDGIFEIKVTGYNISEAPQSYNIVYAVNSGFEWIFPLESNSMQAFRNTFIRWQWSHAPTTGKIEFKYENELDWIEIGSDIDLATGYFSWLTPDTTARVQLKLTTGNETFTSNLFFITQPLALKVGYNCENEVMLLWNKTSSASQYQLYQLGEKYLEPFYLTVDTFAILNNVEKEILHYSIAPVILGIAGDKSNTINYSTQVTGCYFISFLPRQFVFGKKEDIEFDLILGTTYKLGSVFFERLVNGQWQIIQIINPVNQVNITLTDTNPDIDYNEYRVRLTDTNGTTITISNTEKILYVRDLIIYPNPAQQGVPLNIIAGDEDFAFIKLYDMVGRPVSEALDLGEIKTFDTTTLVRGSYILEVRKSNGQKITRRISIL
jgi:hypothetical protein